MRALGRLLLRALGAVVLLLLTLALLVLVAVQSEPGQRFIREQLASTLSDALGAKVSIGDVDGTLLRSVRLSDVSLRFDGSRLRVARARLSYSLPALLRGNLRFGRVRLAGVRARLVHTEDGWGLGQERPEQPEDGEPLRLRIRRLQIEDGRVAVSYEDAEPRRRFALDDLAATLSLSIGPRGEHVEVRALAFRPRGIAVTPTEIAGEFSRHAGGRLVLRDLRLATERTEVTASAEVTPDGPVSARLAATPLSHEELAAVLPGVPLSADLTLLANAEGRWDAIRTVYQVSAGADGGRGELSGEATIDASAEPIALTADLAVQQLALGVLEGLPAGTVTGEATARGTLARLAWDAEATVTLAAAEDLPVQVDAGGLVASGAPLQVDFTLDAGPAAVAGIERVSAHVQGALRGQTLTLPTIEVTAPEARATGQATLDLETQRLQAQLDAQGDLAPLGAPVTGTARLQLAAQGPLEALPIEGTLVVTDVADAEGSSVRLGVDARLRDGQLAGEVTELTIDPATGEPWNLAEPAAFTVGETALDIEPLRLRADGQQVTLRGRVAWAGPLQVSADWSGLQAGPLCELLGDRPCEGVLEGTATVAGTPEAPRVQLEATAPRLSLGGAELGRVTATADLKDEMLTADVRATVPGAGDVRIAGTAEVRTGAAADAGPIGDLDLAITSDRLDLGVLRALLPREVIRSEGTITSDLRLRGAWPSPQLTGSAELTASDITLRSTGVTYEDVQVRLRATEDGALAVETLQARTDEGWLRGEGRIVGAATGEPRFDVDLRLTDFQAVDTPTYEAEVSGALSLEGDLATPRLTGDITITHAVVRPALLPASAPELTPDPTITIVGRTPAAAAEAEGDAGRKANGGLSFEALAMNVAVTLGRDVWVRRLDAEIELEGRVRLEKESSGPLRLVGTIRSVRGWYAFQGRRFDVDSAEVRFAGEAPPDPALQARARHERGEYTVWVTIGGTLDTPTLDLSSEPSLPEADVLSVLLFGRPTSELGGGEQVELHERAVGLATGYVMPEVRASVLETLQLDELEVSAEGVTVGRYVTDDVFLSVSQEFGATVGQTVGVEYRLPFDTSVRLSTSSRGNSAVDVIWQRRY